MSDQQPELTPDEAAALEAANAHPCDPANPFLNNYPSGLWVFRPPAAPPGYGGITMRVGNATLTAFGDADRHAAWAEIIRRAGLQLAGSPAGGLIVPNGIPDPRMDGLLRRGPQG